MLLQELIELEQQKPLEKSRSAHEEQKWVAKIGKCTTVKQDYQWHIAVISALNRFSGDIFRAKVGW